MATEESDINGDVYVCRRCSKANSNLNHSIPTVMPRNPYANIVDHFVPYDSHDLYDVTFHSHYIQTLVTADPSYVDSWIHQTQSLYPDHRHLTVGLDVEWRPCPNSHRHPVATLQLCVAHRCLIFQILHAPSIPETLQSFLMDEDITFVGVGIEADTEKLLEDYSLSVERSIDLTEFAFWRLKQRDLKNAGLKTMSLRFLELALKKPKKVSMSKWDNRWLSDEQVQYACIDAFVSYKIGKRVLGFNCSNYG